MRTALHAWQCVAAATRRLTRSEGNTPEAFRSTFSPVLELDNIVAVFLRAPPPDQSWWPKPTVSLLLSADQAEENQRINEPHYFAALRMIEAEIAGFEHGGVSRHRIVLVGMSQGAVALNSFALSLAESKAAPSIPLAATIALGGDCFNRVPLSAEWTPQNGGSTTVAKHIFVSSGRADKFFSVDKIEAVADRLRAANAGDVSLRLFDHDHSVSTAQVDLVKSVALALARQ